MPLIELAKTSASDVAHARNQQQLVKVALVNWSGNDDDDDGDDDDMMQWLMTTEIAIF